MQVPTPEQLSELLPYLTQQERDEMRRLLDKADAEQAATTFPSLSAIRNRETGKWYKPHHEAERAFVVNDGPRWVLAKGGEGSGKSVAGIVKSLYKLSRGLSPGLMGSPDFEHFKRSLWPEFRRWCPWDYVVPSQRHRQALAWRPSGPFEMVFQRRGGDVVLLCGGFDDPTAWHGPNLNFVHFDEARRHDDPTMLKVLDGRIRVKGPNGEPPQGFLTSTPKKHWLFDYFGPEKENDPLAGFKATAQTIILRTEDNAANNADGYAAERRKSLTEAEARVFLEAEWEDEDELSPFLPSITLWDACREPLPAVNPLRWPMIIALDAGLTNDLFAIVGVTRNPARPDDLFVWHTQTIRAPRGGEIDYQEVLDGLRRAIRSYNVVEVVYDPYQLAMFSQLLRADGTTMVTQFSQQAQRSKADKALRDCILTRRISHTGQPDLREHIGNANQKRNPEDRQLRIVKRTEGQKIDLAVALSMAAWRCAELPL